MTTTVHNTIFLEANSGDGFRPPKEDRKNGAAATIMPGACIKISGAASVVLADSGNPWQRMVAIENKFSEATSTPAIDDPYAQNETVAYVKVVPGDVFLGIISDGQTIAPGDMLVFGTTDGELIEAGTHDATLVSETVVGFALDTVAPSGANARCRVLAN